MTTPQLQTKSNPASTQTADKNVAINNNTTPSRPIDTGGGKKRWTIVIVVALFMSVVAFFGVRTLNKANMAIEETKTTVTENVNKAGDAVSTGADIASKALESENVQDALNNAADAVDKGVTYIQSDKEKKT